MTSDLSIRPLPSGCDRNGQELRWPFIKSGIVHGHALGFLENFSVGIHRIPPMALVEV